MRSKWPKLAVVLVLVVACIGMADAAKTCPNCGAENRDEARYCKNCGYRFEVRRTTPRRTLPLLRAQVSVEGGVVRLSSTPGGATVEVDGRARGRTPLQLRGLKPGQHELVLSRSGYRTYYGIFVIPKLEGTIVVTSIPPGAEILLDGEGYGVAVDTGLVIQDVPFGSHLLTAHLPGWEDDVRTVQLSAEEPVTVITMRLTTGMGFLRLESYPEGAEVTIDGKQVGSTSYFGMLAPARHRLSLTMPGFAQWNGYADVQQAETTFVAAALARLKTRKPALLWIGITALAGGAAGAVMGELSYRGYQDAATSDDAEEFRKKTEMWDLVRNIGAGIGAAGIGAYIVF